MPSLNQDAIATAIVVEHDETQDFVNGLGHILEYYLEHNNIDYGSVNLNRMAVRVFEDMAPHFEIMKAIQQKVKERDEVIDLTGDDNVIDPCQDEEMINLTGDEHVIDLTGDKDVIDLTGDEDVIDLTDDEHVVDWMGDEVVDLTQHEDFTHFHSVRLTSNDPPPPYSP
ncbi:hypothetical protein EAE96_010939 [Botrytis aclada]|nr:hypothetical protein EAE96_010939 [Botrytis aclada]